MEQKNCQAGEQQVSHDLGTALVAALGAAYSAQGDPHWVEALVDCPGAQGLYVYSIPPELTVRSGDILSVPFGAQQVGAIAIRLLARLPDTMSTTTAIREIEGILTQGLFSPRYWELLNRVAQYYQTPLIDVIRVALPPGLLQRSQRRVRLVPEPERHSSLSALAGWDLLSPVAQQVVQSLQRSKGGSLTWHYLAQQISGASRGVRELQRLGWVESYLEPPTPIRPKLRQAVTLSPEALSHPDLTFRQREILEVLKRQGGDLWLTELLQLCQTSSGTLKTLEKKGLIIIQGREKLRTEDSTRQGKDTPKTLTSHQLQAVETIRALTGPTPVLLYGVTGSGKTEVYLQTIAPILNQGKSALVLVPEIGLTPQITDRFRDRFGNRVCVYHSALSDGERYDTWRQMLMGQPQVVIGTRSAVFAPLPHLGLIVLDEEHDPSFKQDQPMPCYHARSVASWRSELEGCPLVLGSATPSLETWFQIGQKAGNPTSPSSPLFLSLPQRVHARPLPPIEVVDMRLELHQGNRSLFSRSLQQALLDMQDRGQQGILFMHRRGHSTFVSCRSCGYVMNCPYCDVSLTYHHTHEGATQWLRCHYCNHTQLHPPACPACSSPYLKFFGSGTQRVVQELARELPNLRCLRFDSDTTRTKGAHRALLSQFAQGEADLLVGTQMLTKGIDLPQVTLVGIVVADGLLHLSDYCASERAFQTLTQVAGRGGRGEEPGRVVLQTYNPSHPVIQAVAHHQYQSFTETELQHRAALHYPPHGRLVLLRLSSPDPSIVQITARRIAAFLQERQGEQSEHTPYEVLGPAPATILRVAQRYRWQILIKGTIDLDLPPLEALRSLCPNTVNLTIDVDPLGIS